MSTTNTTIAKVGTVITRTRRKAVLASKLSSGDFRFSEHQVSNQLDDITVGDLVALKNSDSEFLIKETLPRKNCLFRSSSKRRKNICANVDLVLIISAAGTLGNTIFIDRVLTAAQLASIPAALVVNKEDAIDPQELVAIYSALSIKILTTSTKTAHGLESLQQLILSPELSSVVLCGLSGVGKSSIINQLVPSAERRTQKLSRKTGQGQQTTTQSYGFFMERSQKHPLLLIDTPGVQNFGLSHLTPQELRVSFEEFVQASTNCKYRDCMHADEDESECEVIRELQNGNIHPSRYASYLNILSEVDLAQRNKYS